MKLIFKLLSILLALFVYATATSFLNSYMCCWAIKCLIGSGVLGVWRLLLWMLVMFLGPYGVVQLWRAKASGRLIGMILFAATFLNSLASVLQQVFYYRSSSMWVTIIGGVFSTLGFVALYCRSGKAVCGDFG